MKLQKALYGLMQVSLLFYRKLRKELKGNGLVVNPYDPCVANMMMKGRKQLTVVWHADNLMILCEDYFELTKFPCYLGSIYGIKLSMHMGRKHEFLGVDMEFCEDGALEVSLFKYWKNAIEEFPEIICRRAATPANKALRDQRRSRGEEAQRRTGVGIPPHGGTVALHGNEG